MKLNHIDLQVPDVQETVLFFERYFGFELQSSRTSPAVAILTGEGGFVMVLQRRKHEGEVYPENFHIGFYVDDADAVGRFYERAKADGLEISEIARGGRGTVTYLRGPGRLLVEVNHPVPVRPVRSVE